MNYPLSTPTQARAVLRGLRKARGLTQAEAGRLLGVSQKRIARIEADPGRIAFDQLVQLIALLGGRIVVEEIVSAPTAPPSARTDQW